MVGASQAIGLIFEGEARSLSNSGESESYFTLALSNIRLVCKDFALAYLGLGTS